MLSKVDLLKKLQKLLVVEFRMSMSMVGRHDHRRNMRKWLSLEEALKRFPNISTTWKIQRIQQVCCAIPVISPRRKHQIQPHAFTISGVSIHSKAFLKQKKSDHSFNTNWLHSSGYYSGLDPMLSKVDLLKKLQKLLVVEFRMSKVGRHDHRRNMRKWLSLEEALKRFPNIRTTWKIQRIQQVRCAIPVISPRRKH